MTILRPFRPGDKVSITWEMLKDVPATVRKVRTGKDWISVAIDPKDLVDLKVQRDGYFKISPDGYIHLEVRRSKNEIAHRTGKISYGKLGEN